MKTFPFFVNFKTQNYLEKSVVNTLLTLLKLSVYFSHAIEMNDASVIHKKETRKKMCCRIDDIEILTSLI